MVHTYKCPGCGAPLYYSPGEEELICEYCGTHSRVEQLGENDAYDCQVSSKVSKHEVQRENFEGYTCQTCGAQLLTDKYTTATVCCYCGSSALIRERLDGVVRPAGVIPFKLDKNQVKKVFRDWICRGLFTPSIFKNSARIEEIKGIYVPFWLYDYDADVSAKAEGRKVHTQQHGDTMYTHTDYYRIERKGFSSYRGVPVDASKHMDDALMDAMEPYDYREIKEFEMPYLSGFESEKCNYESDSKEMTGRAESRVTSYAFQDVRETVQGYSSVRFLDSKVSLQRKDVKYVLLPVWILTYRYRGENKVFAINGQTGKQIGILPNSKQKMALWFGGVAGTVTLMLALLGGLFG